VDEMGTNASPLELKSVRDLAEHYGLGSREIEALTVFVERLRVGDPSSGVNGKGQELALARLVESLDALTLEPVLAATEAADIGSGLGIPGLALAAALPEVRVTLIEQKASRARFLRDSVEAMSLQNVEVVQRSVQHWAAGQGRFDLVTSRNVVHPRIMVRLAAPLLRAGGSLVLWAREDPTADLQRETHAGARACGLVPIEILSGGRPYVLHTYVKADSTRDGAAVEVPPSPPSLRSRANKAAVKLPRNQARLADVSGQIAELQERRASASGDDLRRLESELQRLEARRTTLAEQIALRKDLVSAQAAALEELRARYEHEDRLGVNQESRRLLAEHPPALDDLQSELVERLHNDGIAEVELARLFSDDVWNELVRDGATFTREIENKLSLESVQRRKDLIHRRHGGEAELSADDPWLRVAISPRLLDVVNTYLGLWAKLTYCDQRYIVPLPPDLAQPEARNWRRAQADRHVIGVRIHLSDIDPAAGPLEYVRGSTGDGPYSDLCPWVAGVPSSLPPDELHERVPAPSIRTLTGPAGTIVLFNASGFHREGLPSDSPQILGCFKYSSPAARVLSEGRFTVEPRCLHPPSEAARYAVT
jgi:precorrin-6B methylase 2